MLVDGSAAVTRPTHRVTGIGAVVGDSKAINPVTVVEGGPVVAEDYVVNCFPDRGTIHRQATGPTRLEHLPVDRVYRRIVAGRATTVHFIRARET